MIKLWELWRKRYCPRRLYKYGTIGLKVFDDRSRMEKICDWCDDVLRRAKRIINSINNQPWYFIRSLVTVLENGYIQTKRSKIFANPKGLNIYIPEKSKKKRTDTKRSMKKILNEIPKKTFKR